MTGNYEIILDIEVFYYNYLINYLISIKRSSCVMSNQEGYVI